MPIGRGVEDTGAARAACDTDAEPLAGADSYSRRIASSWPRMASRCWYIPCSLSETEWWVARAALLMSRRTSPRRVSISSKTASSISARIARASGRIMLERPTSTIASTARMAATRSAWVPLLKSTRSAASGASATAAHSMTVYGRGPPPSPFSAPGMAPKGTQRFFRAILRPDNLGWHR